MDMMYSAGERGGLVLTLLTSDLALALLMCIWLGAVNMDVVPLT